MINKEFDRKIVLEDGHVFYGYGFGSDKETFAELVFNTSMAGYQEIVSDPSYTYQAVTMTYPLMGNYGMCDEDYETVNPSISALIVRDYNNLPSNFRAKESLGDVMERFGIAGVSGVDTRKLTRVIRDYGSCKVLITTPEKSTEECMERLAAYEVPSDAVSRVSTKVKQYFPSDNPRFDVVMIDCGRKDNIVRSLNQVGCNVTIVPYNTTAEEIKAMNPDGLMLSNGPGNPEDAVPVIEAVRTLKGTLPIFGICLGHQIISLAYGAKTYKLKFGHRGGNHPVKNLKTDKVEITAQNHSYAVDDKTLDGTGLKVTHINLLDNTVEGTENVKDGVFSVQYHPESAPGPQDSFYLFYDFIKLMEEKKNA